MKNSKYLAIISFIYLCAGLIVYIGYTLLTHNTFDVISFLIIFGSAICGLAITQTFISMGDEATSADENSKVFNLDNTKLPAYFYHDFINGFARVERIQYKNDVIVIDYNFINKDGDLISDKWWAEASDFITDNCAAVSDGKMCNLIDSCGNTKSVMWYNQILKFSEDKIAKVMWEKDGTINFINTDGKLLLNEWKKEL